MYRLYIGFVSKIVFAVQCFKNRCFASSDELRANAWDLLSLTCNMLMLRQRIYGGSVYSSERIEGKWMANAALGVLGMTASFATLAEMYYSKWRRSSYKT